MLRRVSIVALIVAVPAASWMFTAAVALVQMARSNPAIHAVSAMAVSSAAGDTSCSILTGLCAVRRQSG